MGSCKAANKAGMLRRTLSEDPQIAALVIELRLARDLWRTDEIQDYIALLDLCINLKHVDIFGYANFTVLKAVVERLLKETSSPSI
jgi:hypothetical protein